MYRKVILFQEVYVHIKLSVSHYIVHPVVNARIPTLDVALVLESVVIDAPSFSKHVPWA